ncbi:DUF397 domain-containing protein [Streptomyces sp. CWNU-52B]|uniref:DUF397 domain-containing protein n=1 Tax=unclassified Streptomyces TaxID=2593676 RepID=UPI0039C45222
MTDQAVTDAAAPQNWRKSSYSGPEGGSCLEVLDGHPTGIPVRDSKNPHGPALLIPVAGWASFVAAVRHGRLPG